MTFDGKRRWFFLAIVTGIGLIIDIGTKMAAVRNLTGRMPVEVVGRYFQFHLLYNDGAIFGLNPRDLVSWFPTNLFFYIFTTIAVIFLLVYYHQIRNGGALIHWGIALILPGALGNLFDRIMHPAKGVVDFIRMGIPDVYYWPTYNMADVYITVGVILMLIQFARDAKQEKREKRMAHESTPEAH